MDTYTITSFVEGQFGIPEYCLLLVNNEEVPGLWRICKHSNGYNNFYYIDIIYPRDDGTIFKHQMAHNHFLESIDHIIYVYKNIFFPWMPLLKNYKPIVVL